jgi:membrane fusion protein (multidrug efflux system)
MQRNLVVVFMLFVFMGCNKDAKNTASVDNLVVKAKKIVAKDIPLNFEFIGQTKGSVEVDINARVEGTVRAIHFEDGKNVVKDQLLYEIDPAPYQAKLAEAQARLAQSETTYIKATNDLARIRPLVEIKALSERDLDNAVAQEGVAKSGVEAAKASLESAEIELSYCKITAPVSGLIGLTKVKVGEFVGRMPSSVVLNTISQLDPVHVVFTVNEKEYLYFVRLRERQIANNQKNIEHPLKLILADGEEYQHLGKLVSVDNTLDPKTGSIKVEASFQNPQRMLRPGQYAKIKAVGEVLTKQVLIPKSITKEIQGIINVFVVGEGGLLQQRQIKVDKEIGNDLLIKEGLQEGDLVVVSSINRLKTGMQITPEIID